MTLRRRPANHGAHARVSNQHASHSHRVTRDADQRSLKIALGLIVTYMLIEVLLGVAAHSLALLADAGHMLTDAGALGISIWAARLAQRPAAGSFTFGFKRAEVLSASANGITLLVIAAIITLESVSRLVHPTSVHGGVVVVVASLGVVVNVTAAWVLTKANRSSLNVEGSFQHILTDLYAFVATIIAGVFILVTGFERADAIASLVVVGLMVRSSWGLLRASGRVLLESAPEDMNLDDVRGHLLGVEHVTDVHDLHAWTLTSSLPTLSAHVVIEDPCFTDGCVPRILDELQACITGHFDVEHSTFQVEPVGHLDHETGTH